TIILLLFFFQAEDGIRDDLVTGVQTCALPISRGRIGRRREKEASRRRRKTGNRAAGWKALSHKFCVEAKTPRGADALAVSPMGVREVWPCRTSGACFERRTFIVCKDRGSLFSGFRSWAGRCRRCTDLWDCAPENPGDTPRQGKRP